MKTWLITGTSRGLGNVFARQALAGGDNVVATARRPMAVIEQLGESPRLLVAQLDVTDESHAREVVRKAVDRFGRLDVVVNNAGYGLVGAIEEVGEAEAQAIFETNVFGALRVIRAALPVLRRQGSGCIVNIGSLSGLRASPGLGLYAATKHALEAITESLRKEVEPLGIRVMVVEPGTIRTDFLAEGAIAHAANRIDAYTTGPIAAVREFVATNHRAQLGDPEKMVALVREAIDADEMPPQLPIGEDALAVIDSKQLEFAKIIAPWRERSIATAHEGNAASALA